MSRRIYKYACWIVLKHETLERVPKTAQDKLQRRIEEAIKNWGDVSFNTMLAIPDDHPLENRKVH